MSALNSFLVYHAEINEEVMSINKKLGRQIHCEELEVIKAYASEMLGYRAYLVHCLAKLDAFLDDATAEKLEPKGSHLTELDRKVKVESAVSAVRMWRDLCKGMVDTIDRRVSYAQSELSYEKKYAKAIGAVGA